MLTTKMIKNTFGAKIEPYGFRYKEFKHRRWTFQFEINNQTKEIVVQKDFGSFQLILEFPCDRHKTWELFGDLEYHSIVRKTDEELEDGFARIKLPDLIPDKAPLSIICYCCQKGGGRTLAFDHAEIQSKYRYWVAEQYRKFGKNWKPLKPIAKTNKNLLTEEAVSETIGEKTKDMGFVYKKLISYFLELEDNDCDMTIQIDEDEWQRNGFYVVLSKGRGYLYSDYFFYEDEADMRMQLNHVGDEIKEIIRQDRISPKPLFHTILKHGYYITPEVDDQFLLQRENMAEQFRARNGISRNAEESKILQCIAAHLDALVGIDFESCKEKLLELGAVYGDLIIRQIGGVWYEYEQWRMKQIHSGIYDVPALDRILPHYDIVKCWENGGSRQLIWRYQEYKWRYEEWKRLCDLAGI